MEKIANKKSTRFTNVNFFKKNLSGFTIIEVISTIVITLVILTVVLGVYISFNRLFVSESNIADAQKNNIFIMNGITEELKKAKSIIATSTINGQSFITGTSTVVIAYPVFDSSNELVAGVSDYGALTFNQASSTATFHIETDLSSSRDSLDKVLGQNVDNLYFRYDNINATSSASMTVVLTTFGTNGNSINSVTQSNAVSMRND